MFRISFNFIKPVPGYLGQHSGPVSLNHCLSFDLSIKFELMKLKALALVFIFLSLFLSSALSLGMSCQTQSSCHQSEDSHDSDTQSETCHSHRTHCCSTSVLITKSIRPIDFSIFIISEFSESMKIFKPAPTLDGPFQPPRV